MMLRYQLDSLEQTRALAGRLLALLPARGGLLILSGPLGAGKTTLTQLLAEQLGSRAQVTSPSYTLIHEYPTPQGVLVHIDAYRLGGAEALAELGLEDYLARARLVVVEWGEALAAAYPEAWQVVLSLELSGRSAQLIPPQAPA